ncbi:unnamed protein product [Hymenolepis diminuta]|uniref:Uncharacterized protein n=1 Tax=Hymenolepis diminuta TaxID=6216 RepID=A0A564ZC22_HYMDI|nr:unnamed protein product [Hymenolepis diminuta]
MKCLSKRESRLMPSYNHVNPSPNLLKLINSDVGFLLLSEKLEQIRKIFARSSLKSTALAE